MRTKLLGEPTWSPSKIHLPPALDPAAEALNLMACEPHVAHRSVVSEVSLPPFEICDQNPPLLFSHHDSGVGVVVRLTVTMSPTLNGPPHAEEVV